MSPRRGPGRGQPDRGPDAYELAVARAVDAPRPEDEAPPLPDGRRMRRVMLYVVLAGLGVALVRGGLGGGAPAVPGSCEHPALALQPNTVRVEGSVRWTLSGPRDIEVVLALDRTTAPAKTDAGWLAGPVRLDGCVARGVFAASDQAGDHTVRVFVVSPGKERVLAQQPLAVGAR